MSRTIAIGDIHGCGEALRALLAAIGPKSDDTVVALGDYVDRGPTTRDVLDQLLALATKCQLIPLRGNHELMMLAARENTSDRSFWLQCGGRETLESYGPSATIEDIPDAHWQFMENTRLYFDTPTHIFTHANYVPGLPMDQQDPNVLLWLSARDYAPGPHFSGKTVIVGHTPQPDVVDLGHLIVLDTGCYRGGWLTAMEIATKHIWQADDFVRLRPPSSPSQAS
jgi:serine/threonine protein phosphatase 1